MYLEKINSPADLKAMDYPQLDILAKEIREKIIEVISKNGGHLGPNLGIVEATIALHHCFETPKDKIIWDVSHQCYVHKLLTGRRDKFHTINTPTGLAGFAVREESEHDIFGSGHAGNALGSAQGIAESREFTGKKFNVAAVIGDGSLTAGMAFEALNNIGYNQTDMIVILNDNKMSISPNVGALSDYLKRLSDISISSKPRREIGTIFEKLGLRYFGPIDGHNIKQLVETINQVRTLPGPKIIHILTQKGKGFAHAEEDMAKWHGVSPFDKITGNSNGNKVTFTDIFADAMPEIAEKDEKIIGIVAAMALGTGMIKFAEKFPKRFYDVGISEQHAVTFAAGLGLEGLKPSVAIYSSFLQRAFDQVMQDVALQDVPVKFFLDKANITNDGPTQYGIFDYSYLRLIPRMIVMSPKDENEFRHMIYSAEQYDKAPVSVRYPRAGIFGVPMDKEFKELEIGKAELLAKGDDITIVGIGTMVQEAIRAEKILREKGISASVINARFVKPLDEKMLLAEIGKSNRVITIEENVVSGGFGSGVLEMLEEKGLNPEITCLAAPDKFFGTGDSKLLKKEFRLDAEGIVVEAEKMVKRK